MFRRHRPDPGLPSPNVVVEVHEFRGQWFVTGQWSSAGGIAVDRAGPPAELGEAVLAQIEAARRAPVPWLIAAADLDSVREEQAGRWEGFCEQVAGVTVAEYRPEKRLLILADEQGLRCADDRASPPVWRALPAGSPDGIGATLSARLTVLPPCWPPAAVAVVARDRDAILVCRQHGVVLTGPIARLTGDAGPELLGSEVLAALADARPDPGGPIQPAVKAFEKALRGAGWTIGAFDAAAQVAITRTATGDLTIAAAAGGQTVRVEDPAPEVLGARVLTLLGEQPGSDQAVPPSLRPVAFGSKTGWIAVRGATVADVAGALGLRKRRQKPWGEGVDAAYASGVFVCPPITGWVLAMGADILLGQVDIAGLSRRLATQVQIFRTHRVSEAHEWALADGGVVRRRLICDDSGPQQIGEPTSIERSLAVHESDATVGEGDVFAVAGAWSLDPTSLGQQRSDSATGTWGRLP